MRGLATLESPSSSAAILLVLPCLLLCTSRGLTSHNSPLSPNIHPSVDPFIHPVPLEINAGIPSYSLHSIRSASEFSLSIHLVSSALLATHALYPHTRRCFECAAPVRVCVRAVPAQTRPDRLPCPSPVSHAPALPSRSRLCAPLWSTPLFEGGRHRRRRPRAPLLICLESGALSSRLSTLSPMHIRTRTPASAGQADLISYQSYLPWTDL